MERDFFLKDVVSQSGFKKIVFASYRDTIDNDFFSYLKNFVRKNESKYSLTIRYALPEEKYAIKEKRQ